MALQQCTGPCARTLPLSEFSLRETGRPRRDCKSCRAAYRATHYRANTQRVKDAEHARRAANRDKINAIQNARYAAVKADPTKYAARKAIDAERRARIGPEQLAAKGREYWARTREQQKAKRHVANYGMSIEEVQAIDGQQEGRCAVCQKLPTSPSGDPRYISLVSDHDHTTGLFRGRVCNNCNRAMGYAGDSPDVLDALAAYLRASRNVHDSHC